jgi:hypothetical protein
MFVMSNMIQGWALFASVMMGCAARPTLDPAEAQPALAVYHLHLPGIGGDMPVERWWCAGVERGACASGTTVRSDLYDWTGPGGPMRALQNYTYNRAQGQLIAQRLTDWRRAHPQTRLVLTAASGGAGPAVWALEALPDDVTVDEVVLVSPALSPTYDLSDALARVRGKMHVFVSNGDAFILGWGTSTYGTIDRKKVEAAGRRGFVRPDTADEALYDARLVHVPYQPAWRRYLNFGGHAEALSPSFGRHVIAPLVAGK